MTGIADSKSVFLEIPPKPQFVSLCRLALTAVCTEYGFSSDEIADLKLAITEACSNSIKHAYNGVESDDAKVLVTYTLDGDTVTVEVRDFGPGFDWTGPTMEELPEGGMGISIIQAVCDEISVNRPTDGPGAQLILTKVRQAV